MRKKLNVSILLLLFMGFLAIPGFAQRQLLGGVKGGLNLADISFDPDEDDDDCCDMKAGFVAGVFANFGTEMVSFQPELLYSMKGGKGSDDSKFKLNVVEVPLLLRADLPTGGSVRPFVVVGPAF